MAQPPTYEPATFANKTFDSGILADLDTELANLKSFVDAVRTNLAAIQRDDTKLKNDSVHKSALASEALALFTSTWNPRGSWATGTEYSKLDVVTQDGDTWLCTQDHTSGTFSTDQGNDLWIAVTNSGDTGLLAVTSSGTSSAYTVTTGGSYASWSDVPALLVDWHTSNDAGATINVDGLGAKDLKVEGSAVEAGDLSGQDVVVYDSGEDACFVVGRDQEASVGASVQSAITSNKTLTNSDLEGVTHYIQPVDFSSGSGNTVALTLPAASDNKHKLVTLVVSADAGESSDNKAQLKNNGGTELATLFQSGDRATFASDGSSWVFIFERITLEWELALTANETIAATSAAKVFDAGYSVEKNIGQFWDGSTNHRLNHPGFSDPLLLEVVCVRAAHADVSLYPVHSVRGDYLDAEGMSQGSSSFDVPGVPIKLASGEHITLEAYNDNAGGQDLFGDTNKDETRVLIRALRRMR